MPEPQSIYECPERMTGECFQRYAICSEEQSRDFAALDVLGQTASKAVMDGYESLVERHISWGRQDVVNLLNQVFQSVADARYDAVNPKRTVVCTGRTLIRNACSAKLKQA